MTRSYESVYPGPDNQVPPEVLIWDAFVGAKTAEARCHAWLARVCSQIPGAQAAAVLVESMEAHTYVPLSVWPAASPSLGRLSAVVEVALRERRGIVQPAPPVAADAATPTVAKVAQPAMHIAFPLMLDQRIAGVVALEVLGTENDVDFAAREIHWGSAWLTNLLGGKELDEAIRGKERVASVLGALAVSLRHGKLQQALFETSSELRRHFGCTRVAIGLAERASVRLAALSEAASFDKNTSLAKAYVQAMNEAHDCGKPLARSAGTADSACPRHDELMAVSGAVHVLSFPLILGARCVGVLTLERSDAAFGEEDLAWLDAFADLAAPVVEQRRAAERNVLLRLKDDLGSLLEKLFGPRHLVWKAAASGLLLLVALLVLVQLDYRVGAKTVIEGEVQRVVAAPFEGFIGASFVRAGDTVKAGQPMATLDDRELRIEHARWSSERDQYDNKLREAMATHDLTQVQVLSAQLRQAEAQLALVTEKIDRAQLLAPYDGVVVSGDLSQQIGAPAEAGKKLFEVAPLQSYRVILQVDEREIRHVAAGQGGQLVMTGIAGDPMPIRVEKVTPVATAQDGKNFFRVEAILGETSGRLRPGMEGVGKIEAGRRSLWWVLTHGFADWLTLTLWAWLP